MRKQSGEEAPTEGVHAIMDRQALGVAELPTGGEDTRQKVAICWIQSADPESFRGCGARGEYRGSSGLPACQ